MDRILDIAKKQREEIKKQLDEEILISHSQFTITNDNRMLIVPQVTEIHEKLISLHHVG